MFLLSAFYENVHETVRANVSGRAGNASHKGTHAYNLDKARLALFGKIVIVLNNLKQNSEFSQYVSRRIERGLELRGRYVNLAPNKAVMQMGVRQGDESLHPSNTLCDV